MNRTSALLLLMLSLESLSCAAYRAQHTATPPEPQAGKGQTTGAANPETIAAFSAVQATLVDQIGIFKQELYAEGKYACCVRPACNQCALANGECRCREQLRKNTPACGECTQGWIEGRGNMPGVDVQKVLETLGCHESVKGEE